ncbi:MAG: T9SS type A sorting domain-containing protein [Vicingaceae bacterium]
MNNSTTLYARKLLLSLLMITTLGASAQDWYDISPPSPLTSDMHSQDIAFNSNGDGYLAYASLSDGNKLSVMKWDGGTWTMIGNSISADQADDIDVVTGNGDTVYVEFSAGNSTSISVMMYDGNTWSYVGGAQHIAPAGSDFGNLARNPNNGHLYISFTDGSIDSKIRVMQYDGTSWSNLGSVISGIYCGYTTIEYSSIHNRLWVVYKNFSGKLKTQYYDFAGFATWTDGAYPSTQTISNSTDLVIDQAGGVFATYVSTKVKVIQLYPNTYVEIGAGGVSQNGGMNPHIECDNNDTLHVSFRDAGASNKVTVRKFNGTNWVNLGPRGYSNSSTFDTDMAFNTNNTAFIAHSSSIDSLYYPIQHTLTVTQVGNGTVILNPAVSGNIYNEGDTVYVTATPDQYWNFVEWTGDLVGTDVVDTIIMDTDKNIEAVFFKPTLIFYVDQNATGNNDGSTWADAFTDLQDALANQTVADEIWVAQGTYIPSVANKSEAFELDLEMKLYGGFVGTETLRNQRDWVVNPTILSGDLNGNDNANLVLGESTRSDNSYNVVRIIGNDVLIDGFTVQDGNADNTLNNDYNRGAAIFQTSSVGGGIEIRNCKFQKNVANHSASVFVYFLTPGAHDVNIDNCIFMNNIGRYGSAFALAVTSGVGNFTVSNCLMANNESVDNSFGTGFSGSAGFLDSRIGTTLNAKLINCTVVDNIDVGTNATVSVRSAIAVRRYDGVLNFTAANNIFYNNSILEAFGSMNSTNCPTSVDLANNIRPDANTAWCGGTSINEYYNNPQLDFNYIPTVATSGVTNSGDNTYVIGTKDYYGNDRILGGTVDLGAFEKDITVGVKKQVFNKTLSIYPNPVKSNITIANLQSPIVNVTVLDVTGKVVKTQIANNNTIDVSNLISGVYFVQIQTEEGVFNNKFIKE